MPRRDELQSLLEAVRLKAGLKERLHETLPSEWLEELERFLDALATLSLRDSRLVLMLLADVAGEMSRLVGAPRSGQVGTLTPPLLDDPTSLAATAEALAARFRGEMKSLYSSGSNVGAWSGRVRRVVSPIYWTSGSTSGGRWPVWRPLPGGRGRISIACFGGKWE